MSESIPSKASYHIKNFFLDPNNYRFIDKKDYIHVQVTDYTQDRIQKRTQAWIEGEKKSNIKDLLSSIKANGFLTSEKIVVTEFAPNQFLVIEGNRRMATLKALLQDYNNHLDIGRLDPKVFSSLKSFIDVIAPENLEEDSQHHLLMMGLQHIGGKKKWPAVNQARLVHDYLLPYFGTNEFNNKHRELYESLGIGKQKLNTMHRTYQMVKIYQESDFGDQFENNMYAIFEEVMRAPIIKNWLHWNETHFQFNGDINLDRFFSWISDYEFIGDTESEDYDEDQINIREKIITKSAEIRDLKLFISNEQALNVMEETQSVARALIESGANEQHHIETHMSKLNKSLEELLRYKDVMDFEQQQRFKDKLLQAKEVLPSNARLDLSGVQTEVFCKGSQVNHFSEITIHKYKCFEEFQIRDLNLINLYVGPNNTGKTSLLESVFCLVKQNDMGAIFKLHRQRGKMNELPAHWLQDNFSEIHLSGIFSGISVEQRVGSSYYENVDQGSDYITSYNQNGFLDDQNNHCTIHTFSHSPLQRTSSKPEQLCASAFNSPYFSDSEALLLSHAANLELKIDGKQAIELVIEFLQQIDDRIKNIELTESYDVERFLVNTDQFLDKTIDLSQFGEGFQRVFEIALTFASSRNGIVCIDEFETAIHFSLLESFALFIKELAEKFNVQVFITTHSKECIDAFVKHNFLNEKLQATLLRNKEGKLVQTSISGADLKFEVDFSNLDIRGQNQGVKNND